MRAAYDAGMRLFDTAPLYGHGLSEHRIGEALRWLDRDSYVLSTKVGRLLRPRDPKTVDGELFKQVLPFEGVYDYSYDGVMRSVDDSLQRLGMHRIDMLLIHDVDVWTHGSEAARLQRFGEVMDGGYHAMVRAARAGRRPRDRRRDQRDPGLRGFRPRRRLRLLPARRPLHAARAGGAGHAPALLRGEGHLAADRRPLQYRHPRHRCGRGAYYNYAPAPAEIMERVAGSRPSAPATACGSASAALQFPLGHPNVATLIPGARSPDEIAQNRAIFEVDIPAAFWAELKHEGLLREDAPTPG